MEINFVFDTITAADLKNLLERIQNRPEEAQDELVSVVNEIEGELQGREYVATQEELRVIDSAMASIDAGDAATDTEIKAAFAKFRQV